MAKSDTSVNRFDRVTALLLLLQTRSVVTAQFLAEHFGVSERTIYRDIRTLENAGVPIGAEAGVGYFLEKSYRLPPISFTLDEAAALLLGEKLLISSLDANSLNDFKQALTKIRAVIDRSDKDYLTALDSDIAVLPTGSHFPLEAMNQYYPSAKAETDTSLSGVSHSDDLWLRECRSALVRRQVVEISYQSQSSSSPETRQIEPIGLFYYSWHWHLIAWCRLRQNYRDFRLDRILFFTLQAEQFPRHSRLTLQQYLNDQPGREELEEVEILFHPDVARFVGEQRYMFGFIDEEKLENGIKMRFLTSVPNYMARWLLQYTSGIEVLQGEVIKQALQQLSAELMSYWNSPSE